MLQMKIMNNQEPLKMKINLPSIPSGGGTSDYEKLNNKPKINGVTLIGNKTTEDLHLKYDDTEIKQDIEDLGIELDNLDVNKVPKTRKINNKTLENDITLTASDIGIGNVFTLKGSKPTIEDLPSTGNQIGDVWYIVSEQVGYIWLNDGTIDRWEQLGIPIDLSNFATKNYVDTEIANAITTTLGGSY